MINYQLTNTHSEQGLESLGVWDGLGVVGVCHPPPPPPTWSHDILPIAQPCHPSANDAAREREGFGGFSGGLRRLHRGLCRETHPEGEGGRRSKQRRACKVNSQVETRCVWRSSCRPLVCVLSACDRAVMAIPDMASRLGRLERAVPPLGSCHGSGVASMPCRSFHLTCL